MSEVLEWGESGVEDWSDVYLYGCVIVLRTYKKEIWWGIFCWNDNSTGIHSRLFACYMESLIEWLMGGLIAKKSFPVYNIWDLC